MKLGIFHEVEAADRLAEIRFPRIPDLLQHAF